MQSKHHEVKVGINFKRQKNIFERFGYKRSRLEKTYPKLCPFYDEFFFQNDNISTQFREGLSISNQKEHGMEK